MVLAQDRQIDTWNREESGNRPIYIQPVIFFFYKGVIPIQWEGQIFSIVVQKQLDILKEKREP